jgi:hypothetical protein
VPVLEERAVSPHHIAMAYASKRITRDPCETVTVMSRDVYRLTRDNPAVAILVRSVGGSRAATFKHT